MELDHPVTSSSAGGLAAHSARRASLEHDADPLVPRPGLGRGSDLATDIAGSIGNATNAIRTTTRTTTGTNPNVRKPSNAGQV